MRIPILRSSDPNEIEGPAGLQPGRWVSINDQLQYIVRFENDPKTATGPAQNVYLHIPVHPRINGNTLKLGSFGFGQYMFTIPPNSNTYVSRLDVRDSLGLYVDVTAGYDVTQNEVFWTFKSIDPATNLAPLDGSRGFLPVSDTSLNAQNDTIPGKGEGYVSFLLSPRKTLLTGDTVSEQASIVFDINDPIPTNIWTNTIDAFAPTSHVLSCTVSHDTISFSWSGQDDPGGVGVRDYTIYVSENNGPFTIYKKQLSGFSDYYVGSLGSQYRFFSIATDSVGNKEALKTAGEASAMIPVVPLPVTWLYFTGQQKGEDAQLNWATASEKNCRNYVVERSIDGKTYAEIGTVQAKGSMQSNNYDFYDRNITSLNATKIYYRLRQIMYDNTFAYSKTVLLPVVLSNSTDAIVHAYPNPFSGTITLQVLHVSNTNKSDKVTLYSVDGRVRYQKQLVFSGNNIMLMDDLPPLEPGIYMLEVTINKKFYTVKMVKQ